MQPEQIAQTDPMTGQPAAHRALCPNCGAPLERIPRHWFDRLVNLFTPVRRYRCRTMVCQWEGRLRYRAQSAPAGTVEKHYDRRIDAP